MGVHYNSYYTSVSQIKGPSGFYNIDILGDGNRQFVYVNQDYDGGGWVCVIANRLNTGGMKNLTYSDAVNSANYRTGSTRANNAIGDPRSGSRDLADYNIWIGTKYWSALSGRVTTGKITVVQFVSGTNGTLLNGSHTKRYRWRFDNFNGTYAMSGAASISDETSTGSPGLYNYHAANGFNLTTYDNDQDAYGANCSDSYDNNPWWYGACWSGSYFGGYNGGYQDGPYWVSSGADYHQYGAIYIK
jgi:hypothetical protein